MKGGKMLADIKNIIQSNSNLTESELQVAVACLWLKIGIPSMAGGEKLASWLKGHKDGIESIFGADDRVYIRTKNPVVNKALAEFIVKEEIGDEIKWIKCKESDRWWLMVWWD